MPNWISYLDKEKFLLLSTFLGFHVFSPLIGFGRCKICGMYNSFRRKIDCKNWLLYFDVFIDDRKKYGTYFCLILRAKEALWIRLLRNKYMYSVPYMYVVCDPLNSKQMASFTRKIETDWLLYLHFDIRFPSYATTKSGFCRKNVHIYLFSSTNSSMEY